jgi:hypothetical protein
MILGDVLKYLNGLCAVIHKNKGINQWDVKFV